MQEDYRSFFSREYQALREEVTGLSGQVEGAVGDRVMAAMDQIGSAVRGIQSLKLSCR